MTDSPTPLAVRSPRTAALEVISPHAVRDLQRSGPASPAGSDNSRADGDSEVSCGSVVPALKPDHQGEYETARVPIGFENENSDPALSPLPLISNVPSVTPEATKMIATKAKRTPLSEESRVVPQHSTPFEARIDRAIEKRLTMRARMNS
eukprot:scaffold22384_cov34-Prasinocladus_malaysianus.AAC.1